MPTEFIVMIVIACVITVAVPTIIFFCFWLPNYKSIMKRAREIDPSVKTIAEAQFVLQKNIMESLKQNNEDKKL